MRDYSTPEICDFSNNFNMKFSYNWLQELVPFKESPQELAELLTLRAFEVERVEQKGIDWVIDISGKTIGPRMADASGHRGLANEIGAILKIKVKSEKLKVTEDKKRQTINCIKIKIENSEDCPRYTACRMEGITVESSPQWMRERLEVCGVQSINNIVDAGNYVMLETGQPLHVFDYEKLKAENSKFKTIVVRRARQGEKIIGLHNKTYELNPEILVVADSEKPLAIAGIKGGKESGVSETTHTIIIESANFNPTVIRGASGILGVRTDASLRFEHGLDPNQTDEALNRLASLLQEIAGGSVEDSADVYPLKRQAPRIPFRPAYANQLIGVSVPDQFYKDVFARLGCAVSAGKKTWTVASPTIRLDLEIEEDLIEEAGRLYGYENITGRMPEGALAPARRNDEIFWEERARDALVSAGFTESILYEFTGNRELDQFFVDRQGVVAVENPISPETAYLTPRILLKYLTSAAENLREFDDIKIFGIGKSFGELKGEDQKLKINERKDLICVSTHKSTSGEEGFYELKGAVDELFESIGITDYWYDDAIESKIKSEELKMYHPYRVAEIKIGDEKIGIIGELHPAVIENIKSKARIAAVEIDFEKLWKPATTEYDYRPVGKYPAVRRDIAVVVPLNTKTETVLNVIENIGGPLLVETDLFDYFQDEALREAEQKSLAFHLTFQSSERTLTDEEIGALIKKITFALEEKEWEVRK